MRKTNRISHWLFFLLVALFLAGTPNPASADTAGPTIDSYAPANGAQLSAGWVTVEVRALDVDGILAGSQQLLINGQVVPAILNYDVKSIDPVSETIIYDYTHAVVTYRKLYTDSIVNAQFTVRDQTGNLSTLNWTFEVSTTPTISNLTPAPNTATANTTPAISATLTHAGGVAINPAGVTMTVDGKPVPANFDPVTGLVSYTPASPLAIGVNHTASVSAADFNNRSSSTQWSFSVIYPDMPVPAAKSDCLRCHTAQPQSHRMNNCAACHDVALRKIYAGQSQPPHFVAYSCSACHITMSHEDGAIAGQTPWYPIDVKYNCNQCHQHTNDKVSFFHKTTTTGCEECHSTSLTQEHNRPGRTDKSGNPIDCYTCHTSARPEVTQAIAANNTACTACHSAGHTAGHVNAAYTALAKDPDMNCAQCHNSDISTEHTSRKNAAGTNYSCDTCHKSPRPEVTAAISNKNKNCEACHLDPAANQPQVHTRSGAPLHDSIYAVTRELACEQCHANNIKTVHVGQPAKSANNTLMDCATCHQNTNPAVQAAIVARDTKCEACHTTRHAGVNHSLPAGYVSTNPNNLQCAACHQESSLTTLHVNKITKTSVTMTCDTCHGSTAPAKVQTAVGNKQAYCDACHMVHQNDTAAHTNTGFTALAKDPDMDCALCHSSIISDEHTARKDAAGLNYTCGTCHNSSRPEVMAAISNKNKNCEACHLDPAANQPQVHTRSGSPLHDSTFMPNPEVNCQQCHSNNLKNGHVGKLQSATKLAMDCATCHNSVNPSVMQAIYSNNTSCTSCHAYPTAKHQPAHITTVFTSDTARTDDCTLCHTKTIKDEHVGKINSLTNQPMTCDSCHNSSDLKVVSTISTKQTNNCETCHTLHPVKDVTQLHDSVSFTAKTYSDPNMNCNSCHNSIVSTEHIGKTTAAGVTMNCDTCHKSSRTDVQNAIATNNLKCETCHTKVHTSPDPAHATNFITIKTMACEKCHDAGSIANDHTKYKTAAGAAITCNTCHQSKDAKVINAIRTNNTKCDACHTTRHSEVQTPHKTTYIPNNTYNCSNCHAAANIAYNMTTAYHKITGVTPAANLLHGGTFVSPWTATSTLTCRDCHNRNTSTNTYYGKLLKGAYTATTGRQGYSTANQLCFFCHATSAYGPGSSRTANTGFKGGGENWHAIGNHTEKGGCMSCHNSKPHSSSKQGFVAIRSAAEPNSLITGYTHTTSYSKGNCTTSCH